MAPVRLVAVIVAAVAAFIIGFLFHGPLFGKLWMKLADVHPTGNEKMSDMYGQMAMNLVVNTVSAYALALVYAYVSTSTYGSGPGLWTGIHCGILIALGFQAPITAIGVIWMKQPVKLWLFECVSALVVFATMGAIVASM